MKRSALALAVLATLAGAASAQSSVTLYGRLDTALTWTDPGSEGQVGGTGSEGDAVFRMNGHDPIGGSRWGLRGTEDLGNGLTAKFVLESGFQSDTGAISTRLFDRQAYVGLASSGMGELRLGRQQTLTREVHLLAGDITGEGELTVVTAVATNRPLFQNFGTRVDNAVQYLSPDMGGLQVRALVAAGEGVTARQQGAMVSYGSGPLKLGAAYEAYADGPGADGSYNKVVTLGASYDFGVATLAAAYQNTRDFGIATAETVEVDGADAADHDAFNVGVMVPFGSFQFRAQYTKSTLERDGAGDLDQDKYGASLRYSLSKRTQLYAVATKLGGDDDETFGRETQVALGIGHNF
jgi:predicted porin